MCNHEKTERERETERAREKEGGTEESLTRAAEERRKSTDRHHKL